GAWGLAAAFSALPAPAVAADQWIECKGDQAYCRYVGHDRLRCPRVADMFDHVYVISGDMLKYYDNGYLNPVAEQAIEITSDMYTLTGRNTSVSMNRKNGDFLRTDHVGRDQMTYRGNCSATAPRTISTQNRF